MAINLLPPSPLGSPPGSGFWNDWYEKLRVLVNTIASGFSWSLITGTPTTVGGYGITDAVTTATTLTANAILLGNAGHDAIKLGSLGTITTVLHGNAAGPPTFGAVVLTTDVSGTLPVANGGTGVTSLASLTANPSASVGLTIVNGGASTFMRSDGAPSLDVSISPSWTGTHTFQKAATGTFYDLTFKNTDTAANSDARYIISVNGAAAGDPFIAFDIAGIADWACGVDNSDNDNFKISASATLGSSDRLITSRVGNTYGGISGTTGMTDGFFYIPSAAGAPTGVPTAVTGHVPMYYDTTNNNFYVYNGAWKKVLLA